MAQAKLNAKLTFHDGRLLEDIELDHCYNIQKLEYECHRQKDEEGHVYGQTSMSEMVITIKTVAERNIRPFYSQLQSGQPHSFYVLFNAFKDEFGRLDVGSEHLTALHFDAYVVGIEDNMTTQEDKDMMSTIRLLVTQLDYEFEFTSKGTIFKLNM